MDRIEQILATMASTLMAVQEEPRDLREVVLTNHQRRISKLEQTMLGNTPRRRGVSFGRGVPRDWPRRPVNFAQADTLPLGLSKQESSDMQTHLNGHIVGCSHFHANTLSPFRAKQFW